MHEEQSNREQWVKGRYTSLLAMENSGLSKSRVVLRLLDVIERDVVPLTT